MTRAAATAYAEAAASDQLFSGRPLPRAGHVLAVTARPGQESASLGRLPHAARSGWHVDLGADAAAARAVQRSALAAHASQAEAQPGMQRRIDRQDDREQVRWLVPPRRIPGLGLK